MKKLLIMFSLTAITMLCCRKDISKDRGTLATAINVLETSQNITVSATAFTPQDVLTINFDAGNDADVITWTMFEDSIPGSPDTTYPGSDTVITYPGGTDSSYPGSDTVITYPGGTDTSYPGSDTVITYPGGTDTSYPGSDTVITYPGGTDTSYPGSDTVVTYPQNNPGRYILTVNGNAVRVAYLKILRPGNYILQVKSYTHRNGIITGMRTGYVKLKAY